MKIEEGKIYKTRDGRKIGPMQDNWCDSDVWPFVEIADFPGMYWRRNGECCQGNVRNMRPDLDIVSEWTSEGPIRTRREIVPGVYGRVCVVTGVDGDGETSINLADRGGSPHGLTMVLNAEELREAAHLFNQLAEVLEENQ